MENREKNDAITAATVGDSRAAAGAVRRREVCNDNDSRSAKRRRIARCEDTGTSLLLEYQPELLGTVRSFLTLREALVLKSTCRQLHNGNNAVFEYSHLDDISCIFPSNDKDREYSRIQGSFLCRNLQGNPDKLHAILRNESFKGFLPSSFLFTVVYFSKTDDGDTVSAILKDGPPFCAEMNMLDEALRKGYTSMATALLQDDFIKDRIQMCTKCSTEIGCYDCINGDECKSKPQGLEQSTYCRSCAENAESHFCDCREYICSECFDAKQYKSCECGFIACGGGRCVINDCRWCAEGVCSSCARYLEGDDLSFDEEGPHCASCYIDQMEDRQSTED